MSAHPRRGRRRSINAAANEACAVHVLTDLAAQPVAFKASGHGFICVYRSTLDASGYNILKRVTNAGHHGE